MNVKRCQIPRLVVHYLGTTSLVGVVGVAVLVALVGPAVGGVASILSSTRTGDTGDTQAVTVHQPADEPVPTREVGE